MIYACNTCYYLFSYEDTPERCIDCGKQDIRPATPEEIQEYMDNRHTEFYCHVNVGSDHSGVPGVRISLTSEAGISFAGETDIDGNLRFDDALDPGVYVVDIIDVPVGFVYNGSKARICITEGNSTVTHFLLTEK